MFERLISNNMLNGTLLKRTLWHLWRLFQTNCNLTKDNGTRIWRFQTCLSSKHCRFKHILCPFRITTKESSKIMEQRAMFIIFILNILLKWFPHLTQFLLFLRPGLTVRKCLQELSPPLRMNKILSQ